MLSKSTLMKHKFLTLMCVESNTEIQELYSRIFEDLTKEIIFASDGEDAYQKFVNLQIDIIISDYDTLQHNALYMTSQIRKLNNNIPIIIISEIEDMDFVINALHSGVTNFVKKPINKELIDIIKKETKQLQSNLFFEQQRDKELIKLQAQKSYNSYQEDLAFAKELNILRNDFYYQMLDSKHISLVDFLYQPLDTISGDAYTARRVDKFRTFYLIVDGMGKGLSASLTAMIMTSFINHLIDKMIKHDSFSFDILIKESMDYMKPILLDEETVAIDYILFDTHYDMLSYAKFAMPASLLQDREQNIIKLKSNNPPLSKYQTIYTISEQDISKIDKFLFFSDGIIENSTLSKGVYSDFIEEDFRDSFTREDLKKKFFAKIDEPEDDLTLIFINRLPLKESNSYQRDFKSSFNTIEAASIWYDDILSELCSNQKAIYNAGVVFTELYMNAYEHGNLNIDSTTKHKLLENDIYFETLRSKGAVCTKKITVKVSKIKYNASAYIITQITDEGNGFDTQILSEIFRNSALFNGRGVFVSRKNSLGIYYNSKGNSVLYLNKV